MSSKINAISAGVGGLATSADASGILELQTNDTTAVTVNASQVVSFGNNFGTVAGLPAYQCRAWVNFNGTGTVAIRASGNVSSITDNGVGDYTINFATALSDDNYVCATGVGNVGATGNLQPTTSFNGATQTSSGFKVITTGVSTYAYADQSYVFVVVFGN